MVFLLFILCVKPVLGNLPGGPVVETSCSHCRCRFDPWRRQWHPTPVLLPGKSHGRRSLEGCSPWGHWGLDTTVRLHFHFHALEKEMATHSSVLAWRIPGTGEPGGLPSMGSHRVRHYWSNLAAAAAGKLESRMLSGAAKKNTNKPVLASLEVDKISFFTVVNSKWSSSACMLSSFSRVQLFATSWTVACQGSPVPGILQARILEWVAIPSFKGSSRPRDRTRFSCLLHWQQVLHH